MNYTASTRPPREAPDKRPRRPADKADKGSSRRSALLLGLGAAVRARRAACGLTRRALAARARVSERFLVQLEAGEGNISVVRLQDVADALGTSAAELLAIACPAPSKAAGVIALLGLRGAGKSSVGRVAAERLRVPFVELDEWVAREAGMSLATIFELHGEGYFRRIERDALERFLDATPAAVLATSGSLVTDPTTFALLRRRATTVWLKARPDDHWTRVVAQGDGRPMRDRADAMSELKSLLRARKPLYALADHVVDTSSLALDGAIDRVVGLARAPSKSAVERGRRDARAPRDPGAPRDELDRRDPRDERDERDRHDKRRASASKRPTTEAKRRPAPSARNDTRHATRHEVIR